MREALRPILELAVVIPGLLLAYFPVKSFLKQPRGKLAAWLAPMMLGALRRRRAALLAFSGVYGVCNRMRDGDCGFPVRQNKSDFSLEVRNHRAFRLCGVCLPKQPVQSAQHSHTDAHPNDTDRAVVLPAGVYRL